MTLNEWTQLVQPNTAVVSPRFSHLLSEIIRKAYHESASPTLYDILHHNDVLTKDLKLSDSDVQALYGAILSLSRIPGNDWNHKLSINNQQEVDSPQLQSRSDRNHTTSLIETQEHHTDLAVNNLPICKWFSNKHTTTIDQISQINKEKVLEAPLRKFFCQWRDHVQQAKIQLSDQRQSAMRRIMANRFQTKSLQKFVFCQWKRHSFSMMNCINRYLVQRSFRRWRRVHHRIVDQFEYLKLSLNYWYRNQLRRAFNGWYDWAQRNREALKFLRRHLIDHSFSLWNRLVCFQRVGRLLTHRRVQSSKKTIYVQWKSLTQSVLIIRYYQSISKRNICWRYLKIWKIIFAQKQLVQLFRYRHSLRQTFQQWRGYVQTCAKRIQQYDQLITHVRIYQLHWAMKRWKYQYNMKTRLHRCFSIRNRECLRLVLGVWRLRINSLKVQDIRIESAERHFRNSQVRRAIRALYIHWQFSQICSRASAHLDSVRLRLSIRYLLSWKQQCIRLRQIRPIFQLKQSRIALSLTVKKWKNDLEMRLIRRRNIQRSAENWFQSRVMKYLLIWVKWVRHRHRSHCLQRLSITISNLCLQRRCFSALLRINNQLRARSNAVSLKHRSSVLHEFIGIWRRHLHRSLCAASIRRRLLNLHLHHMICQWRVFYMKSSRLRFTSLKIICSRQRAIFSRWRSAIRSSRTISDMMNILNRIPIRSMLGDWVKLTHKINQIYSTSHTTQSCYQSRLLLKYFQIWTKWWTISLGCRRLVRITQSICGLVQKRDAVSIWRNRLGSLKQQQLRLNLIRCRQRVPILRWYLMMWFQLLSLRRHRIRYLIKRMFCSWNNHTQMMSVAFRSYRFMRLSSALRTLRCQKQRRLSLKQRMDRAERYRRRTLFHYWMQLKFERSFLNQKTIRLRQFRMGLILRHWILCRQRLCDYRRIHIYLQSLQRLHLMRSLFRSWHSSYDMERSIRLRSNLARQSYQYRRMQSALNHLRHYAQRRRTLSICCSRLAQIRALRYWSNDSRKHQRLSQVTIRLISNRRHLHLITTVRSLRSNVDHRRLYRCMQESCNIVIQSRLFLQWRCHCRCYVLFHRHRMEIIKFRRRCQMRWGYQFWRYQFNHRNHLHLVAARMLLSFANPQLRSGWNTWRQFTHCSLISHLITNQAIRHRLSLTFLSWRQSIRLHRFRIRRCSRIRLLIYSNVWNMWRHRFSSMNLKRSHLIQLCNEKIAPCLQNLTLHYVMSNWRKFVIRQQHHRTAAKFLLEHVRTPIVLRASWNAWRNHLNSCQSYRVIIFNRFIRRIKKIVTSERIAKQAIARRASHCAKRFWKIWLSSLYRTRSIEIMIKDLQSKHNVRQQLMIIKCWAHLSRLTGRERLFHHQTNVSCMRKSFILMREAFALSIRDRIAIAAFYERLENKFPDMITMKLSNNIKKYQKLSGNKAIELRVYYRIHEYLSPMLVQSAVFHCLLNWRNYRLRLIFRFWKINIDSILQHRRKLHDADKFRHKHQIRFSFHQWQRYIDRCRKDRISLQLWKISISARYWQRWIVQVNIVQIERLRQERADFYMKWRVLRKWRDRLQVQSTQNALFSMMSSKARLRSLRSVIFHWHYLTLFYRNNSALIEREHLLRPSFCHWQRLYQHQQIRTLMLQDLMEQTRICVARVCFLRWKSNAQAQRRRRLIQRCSF